MGVSQICCGLFDHLLIERLGCGDPSICAPVTVVTPPPTFEEAVEIALKLIASGRAIDRSDQFTPEHGRHIEALSMGAVAIADGEEADLIEQAASDALAYEALSLGIALSLERGWEISPALKDWLIAHLRGDQKCPPRGRGQPKNPGRDSVIVLAVHLLVRMGMRPMRNDASETEDSACDAVAAAANAFRTGLNSYARIKELWLKRDKGRFPGAKPRSVEGELPE